MNKHSSEYLESIAPDIKRAAEKVARQFPSIEYDDIYQNLWVYVLETKTELIPGGGSAVGFLVQEGQRQCGKELAERNPRPDAFYYSPKIVKKMLDSGLMFYDDAGDICGRSDMTTAFGTLGPREQELIVLGCLDKNPDYTAHGSAKNRALHRAIDKLAMEMNRIGEGRSEWHREREISGYTGSRKTANQTQSDY